MLFVLSFLVLLDPAVQLFAAVGLVDFCALSPLLQNVSTDLLNINFAHIHTCKAAVAGIIG